VPLKHVTDNTHTHTCRVAILFRFRLAVPQSGSPDLPENGSVRAMEGVDRFQFGITFV